MKVVVSTSLCRLVPVPVILAVNGLLLPLAPPAVAQQLGPPETQITSTRGHALAGSQESKDTFATTPHQHQGHGVIYTVDAMARVQQAIPNDKTREVGQAFEAGDYRRALILLNAEADQDARLEYRHRDLRYRAIAHVNFADFKKRGQRSIVNTSGNSSVYFRYCRIIADDNDFPPDVYRFGRALVDEALQTKQQPLSSVWLLHLGAKMDANRGDMDAAVRTQTMAVEAGEAIKNYPPLLLKFLRTTLTKLKAAAGN